MPVRSAILLCDNAGSHIATLTQEKLNKTQWKILEHPLYSPDHCMFVPLKEELGGYHFDDDDGVKTFVRNWLRTRRDSFFDDEIKNFDSFGKCANTSGDYVEK